MLLEKNKKEKKMFPQKESFPAISRSCPVNIDKQNTCSNRILLNLMYNMLEATRRLLNSKMQHADVNVKLEINRIFLHMHELQSHYELQLIEVCAPKIFYYTSSYDNAKEQIKKLLQPYPGVQQDFTLSIEELETQTFQYHPSYPLICNKPDCLRSAPLPETEFWA